MHRLSCSPSFYPNSPPYNVWLSPHTVTLFCITRLQVHPGSRIDPSFLTPPLTRVPLPELKIPLPNHLGDAHPLQILSVPRPSWRCYQTVSSLVSSLQDLRVVRTPDADEGSLLKRWRPGHKAKCESGKRGFASRAVISPSRRALLASKQPGQPQG